MVFVEYRSHGSSISIHQNPFTKLNFVLWRMNYQYQTRNSHTYAIRFLEPKISLNQQIHSIWNEAAAINSIQITLNAVASQLNNEPSKLESLNNANEIIPSMSYFSCNKYALDCHWYIRQDKIHVFEERNEKKQIKLVPLIFLYEFTVPC